MEAYPILDGKTVKGFVRTFSDFVELENSGRKRVYLWSESYGFRLKEPGNFYRAVYEAPLTPSRVEPVEDLVEKRVSEALASLGNTLRGKRVMADLSGGKDSTAQLVLLARLQELVDFKLFAVYVHVPFLEPLENIDYAEKIAEKLGVELYYTEADRKMMAFYLAREGLPQRGARWCTYLKTRALREVRKKLGADFEAKGDRMLESGKRMEKLGSFARRGLFAQGKTLNLIYDFSALDTACVVKKLGLVHPHYLLGIPRVSCRFCPYRGLYELEASRNQEVEDIGLVEYSARRAYRKLYSTVAPWDMFWDLALWRFQPTLARWRVQEIRNTDYTDIVSLSEVAEAFRSIWVSGSV